MVQSDFMDVAVSWRSIHWNFHKGLVYYSVVLHEVECQVHFGVCCRMTVQPNDPNNQPLVGCKLPLETLISAYPHDKAMQMKLHTLVPFFPRYRPIIGDGNCFYRSLAFGLVEHIIGFGDDAVRQFRHQVKFLAVSALAWLEDPAAAARLGQEYTQFKSRARVLVEVGYSTLKSIISEVCRTSSFRRYFACTAQASAAYASPRLDGDHTASTSNDVPRARLVDWLRNVRYSTRNVSHCLKSFCSA
jgi:hypothetical protein